MQDIGAGRLVGERYLLEERRAHLGELEVWRATTISTGLSVYLTAFPLGRRNAEEILDSARRCSALRDPRLIDVVDVGRSGEVGWFVEEAFEDAVTLTHLLQEGPLPGEEARRIVGEIAEVLDVAAAIGLHHLHVTPHAVRRRRDGSITLAGLAVAGAIEGDDDNDPATAQEIDALHTLAVGYAALTTRWPLAEPIPGLQPAPRIVGGVAAPSEIAVGVPADLDALCRSAFNDGKPPRTPNELVRAVAPWSRDQVGPVDLTRPDQVGPGLDETQELAVVSEQARAADRAVEWASSQVTASTTRRTSRTCVAAPDPASAGAAAPGAAMAALASRTKLKGQADMAGASNAPRNGSPSRQPADPMTESRTRPPEGQSGPPTGDAGDADQSRADAADSRPATVSTAVGSVTAAFGSFARAAADRAAAARERLAEERAKVEDGEGPSHAGLSAALGSHQDPAEPEPGLFEEGAPERDGTHARLVLIIVAACVVLALVLALPGLFLRGGGTEARPAPAPGVTAPGAPSASSAPSHTPTATGPIVRIVNGTGFDPQGDGAENGSAARRAFDADPATSWTSEGYNTGPRLPGKEGVGVVFTIPADRAISSVTLTLPSDPQDVTLYTSDRRSLTGATEIAALPGASGTREVSVGSPQPSRYVIVWFTSLAKGGNRYRASLSEIALRG